MTTYTLGGDRLTFQLPSDDLVAVGSSTLVFDYPAATTSVTYSIDSSFPFDPFPVVDIMPEADRIILNGRDITGLDGDDGIFFTVGQITWSGGTTYLLDIYEETGGSSAFDHIFVLGGAALPDFSTVAEVETFLGPALGTAGAAGGAFGPGQSITLASIPNIEVSTPVVPDLNVDGGDGPDTIAGGDGNDTLRGFGGDDTINGGDGSDTINGGDGNDTINGGATSADRRDTIFGGTGDDNIDAGHGNDLVYGQDGNDTIAGGFGADELFGQNGNDVITGSAFSDLVFGGAGDDFVNGGFGFDRINGGSGADRFFHAGADGHASDWLQDYSAAEGDVLLFGNAGASASDFVVRFAHTASAAGERSGDDDVQEAFVNYRGQTLWALVDGGGQTSINLQIGGEVFDLLA